MESIVELRNVTKHYRDFQLRNISLDIPKGSIMGLVGPNGAGKTTLIKCIMNLTLPTSGSIKIFGKGYKQYEKDIKKKIGFVYDNPGFYQDQTVKNMKNIIAPFYPSWNEQEFQSYRNLFELPANKQLQKLSRGMKMKFSLAVALSHNAEFILLDEPTSGLDPLFRRELLEILDGIIDREKTILFSTHITSELDQIADFITYISQGEIIFSDAKDEILNTYAVIKGPKQSLSSELREHLIGNRKTNYGFKALTNKADEFKNIQDSQIMVESATLEDIVFYYGKRGGRAWVN